MFRSPITLLLVALLMVWAVGCSDNPLETSGDTPNLSEDFGGYTARLPCGPAVFVSK